MIDPQDIKVRILGYGRWGRVFCDQLQAVGMRRAFCSEELGPMSMVRRAWHMCREITGLDIEHVMYPNWPNRFHYVARPLGVRVVNHWLGSDVQAMALQCADVRRRNLRLLNRYSAAHVADSPELAAELAEMGVEASVVRLLPVNLQAKMLPLPEQFAVLSYWGLRPEFYRAGVVFALAAENPEVPFFVVGTDGQGLAAPPNVRFLGMVNMDEVYPKVSVLIRMPEHDSISVMVLEALLRGRRVIYSKPFPHTHFAQTLEEARAALAEVRRQMQPHVAGAEHVRANFDPLAEARNALKLYRRLLERS